MISNVYSYYMAEYGIQPKDRHSTHKKSELRDIYNNIVKISRTSPFFDVDLSEDLKCHNGKWFCYYELAKNELPISVYGHSQPLQITKCYQKHDD